MLPNVTLEDLLEAGAHFGHQTHRWHPKMEKYIFGDKAGIHLLDLKKTLYSILEAYEVVRKTVSDGGTVIFVGTKKQAKGIIKEEAERCGMHYVSERWLGGMLTNFRTIRSSVDRMKEIEKSREDGTYDLLTKKEALELDRDHARLAKVLSGVRDMNRLPNLLFIVDTKKEEIPVREANKLDIPIVGLCDTNSDPRPIDYPIPANDDAVKSIKLITSAMADAVLDGKSGSQLLQRIDKESKAQKKGKKEKQKVIDQGGDTGSGDEKKGKKKSSKKKPEKKAESKESSDSEDKKE